MDADSSAALAAWWGAVVATLVALWEVYKWAVDGPRLRFEVMLNHRSFFDPKIVLVAIRVTNTGNTATELRALHAEWFPTWWQRLRRRPTRRIAVLAFQGMHGLPYRLKPASVWSWNVAQVDEKGGYDLAALAATGHLVLCLRHTLAERPVRFRVSATQHKGNRPAVPTSIAVRGKD